MTKGTSNRPTEIFGCPIENESIEAQDAREQHWCPFVNKPCNKKSRLIDYPFGVCSVEHRGEVNSICPRRFEEQGSFVSTTVDEVYQAMRNNPNLPNKDEFVNGLNRKLRARLSVKFS